jgi:hypothetical protein
MPTLATKFVPVSAAEAQQLASSGNAAPPATAATGTANTSFLASVQCLMQHRVLPECLAVLRHFSLPAVIQNASDVRATRVLVAPHVALSGLDSPPSLQTLAAAIKLCDLPAAPQLSCGCRRDAVLFARDQAVLLLISQCNLYLASAATPADLSRARQQLMQLFPNRHRACVLPVEVHGWFCRSRVYCRQMMGASATAAAASERA